MKQSKFSEETIGRVEKYFLKNPYICNATAAKALGVSSQTICGIRKYLEENNRIEPRPKTNMGRTGRSWLKSQH